MYQFSDLFTFIVQEPEIPVIKSFFNRSAANRICTIMKQQELSALLQDRVSSVVASSLEERTSDINKKIIQRPNSIDIMNILNSCDMDDMEVKKKSIAPLFRSKYPHKKWTVWSYRDQDGIVFGWPEDIHFFVVGTLTKPIVVEISLSFTKSQLATLNRKLALYQKKTGRVNRQVVVLCGTADEDATEMAKELKYDIQLPG